MISVRDTIAWHTLKERVADVGGNNTAVQSIFESVGLRVSPSKLKGWLSGERIPTSMVSPGSPSPGVRHLINTWLGIPDEYWWTRKEKEEQPSIPAWGFFPPDEDEGLGGY